VAALSTSNARLPEQPAPLAGLPDNLLAASEFHLQTLRHLGRSPGTLTSYRIYQRAFITFLEEQGIGPDLGALTPQLVRACQGWIRARSRGRRGGVVTEKQMVTTLKTWSRWLWDNEVYSFDPLARLRRPRVPKVHRKPFSEEEAQHLVAAASASANPLRDRALLLLLLDTGCRIGELCSATVADVDLVKGSILFRHTKGGAPREVGFRKRREANGGPCLVALRTWLRVREAHDGVEELFTTRERWPLGTRRAREIIAQLGQAAHVPNAHPHRFRHTAASQFLAERPGAEIQLRSRLGHVDDATLADYITISDPAAAEAADVASLSAKWHLGSQAEPRSAPASRRVMEPRTGLRRGAGARARQKSSALSLADGAIVDSPAAPAVSETVMMLAELVRAEPAQLGKIRDAALLRAVMAHL